MENKHLHPPEPGLYRHYKGRVYQVLDTCRHSETGEQMVLYRAFQGEAGLWVRPVDMFSETVVVEGQSKPRFEFLSHT